MGTGGRGFSAGLAGAAVVAMVFVGIVAPGWGGDRRAERAASDPAKADAKRGRTTVRMALRFALRDVRVTRGRRGRVKVVARAAGRGVLRATAPKRFTRRMPARSLAVTYRSLVGPKGPSIRFGSVRVRLGAVARVRRGRLTFRGRRTAGRGARRVRLVRVRASVRRRVATVGRCPLVPFARCPRAELGFGDLYRADLRGANLRNARMQRAFLHGAKLAGADLGGADLRAATLVGADLRGARLQDAILADAGLRRARLGRGALRAAHVCQTFPPRGRRRNDDCSARQPRNAGAPRRTPTVPATATAQAPAPRAKPARKPQRPRRLPALAPGETVAKAAQSTNVPCQKTSSDRDGDCLADATESAGWTLAVTTAQQLSTTNPNPVSRTVTSSPTNPDTDGDGGYDGYEYENVGDPTKDDTDGDGLADGPKAASPKTAWEYPYASDLNNADSDGDSAEPGGGRDPELFDGQEANGSQTSPRQADTDGDGQNDYVEVTSNSPALNPLVAEIPQPSLISKPGDELSISVPYTVSDGVSTTNQTASSTQTTSTSTQTHSFDDQFSFEASQSFEEEGRVGIPVGVSTTTSFSFTEGAQFGNQNTWQNTSQTQQEYSQFKQDQATRTVTTDEQGCMTQSFLITNPTSVSLSLTGLNVIATTPDITNPGSSQTVGIFSPVTGSTFNPGVCNGTSNTEPIEVPAGGGQVTVPMQVSAASAQLLQYMANPTPINYEITFDSMTGETTSGQSIDYSGAIATTVNAQDAGILVDYGNGKVQTFFVAADVLRNADGSAAGITIEQALGSRMANLSPEFSSDGSAVTSLGGVDNASQANDGTWVYTTNVTTSGAPPDVEDIVLKPGAGQFVAFTYMSDSDNDGVPNNQENSNGTSNNGADTDGDGLTDKQETVTGWTVPFQKSPTSPAQYTILSSPINCDADGDGSPDGPGQGNAAYGTCPQSAYPPESVRASATSGTDPTEADTNGDAILDGAQGYPAVLQYFNPQFRMPVFSGQFGGEGSGSGRFNGPVSIAVNKYLDLTTAQQQIFVADYHNKVIQKFLGPEPCVPAGQQPPPNTNLPTCPSTPPPSSNTPPAFTAPTFSASTGADAVLGLTVSPKKTLKDTDPPPTNPAQLLWASGTEIIAGDLQAFSSANLSRIDHGGFTPAGGGALDVDPSGNLYVASGVGPFANVSSASAYEELRKLPLPFEFSPSTGKPTGSFTTPRSTDCNKDPDAPDCQAQLTGIVNNPQGVALDPQGNVYMVDGGTGVTVNSITKFSPQLSAVAWDNPFAPPAEQAIEQPQGIAVDAGDGSVYVTDLDQDYVAKFTSSLSYIGTFGGPGAGNGRFNQPMDLDVDQNGNVYVVDYGNDVVQYWQYPKSGG